MDRAVAVAQETAGLIGIGSMRTMPVWLRGLLLLLSGALLLVSTYVAGMWFLMRSMCGNDLIKAVPSPDGIYTAFLFERDCGATTGFSTQASILPNGVGLPNESGNIFIAEATGDAGRGAWGGPEASIRWLDRHTLELRYKRSARTFLKENGLGRIGIIYRAD